MEVKSDLILKHVVETSSTEELHSPVGDWAGPGCVIAVSDWLTVLPELTLEGKERHGTLWGNSVSIYSSFLLDFPLAALVGFDADEDSWMDTLILGGCLESKKMSDFTVKEVQVSGVKPREALKPTTKQMERASVSKSQ